MCSSKQSCTDWSLMERRIPSTVLRIVYSPLLYFLQSSVLFIEIILHNFYLNSDELKKKEPALCILTGSPATIWIVIQGWLNAVNSVVRTPWLCLYCLDEYGPNVHLMTHCAHTAGKDPCSSATCKSSATLLGPSGTLWTLCCFDTVEWGAVRRQWWACPHDKWFLLANPGAHWDLVTELWYEMSLDWREGLACT